MWWSRPFARLFGCSCYRLKVGTLGVGGAGADQALQKGRGDCQRRWCRIVPLPWKDWWGEEGPKSESLDTVQSGIQHLGAVFIKSQHHTTSHEGALSSASIILCLDYSAFSMWCTICIAQKWVYFLPEELCSWVPEHLGQYVESVFTNCLVWWASHPVAWQSWVFFPVFLQVWFQRSEESGYI